MYSHPGSGLEKGVGVPLSPRATWAWVAISYLLHPLAPSRELPSLTATCHHLYTGTPKVTKTDCCLLFDKQGPLFPHDSVETYKKAWRISR